MGRAFPGIPEEVIEAAKLDPQVVLASIKNPNPIVHAGQVVGFYCPRQTPLGFRIGPVFVLPTFRRLGLVKAIYAGVRGPCVACIRDDNPASRELHVDCGFVFWKRYSAGAWWRRP